MRIEVDAQCPLPEDPVLGEVAMAMEQAELGLWADFLAAVGGITNGARSEVTVSEL